MYLHVDEVVLFYIMQWGSQKNLLAANNGESVQILAEHIMNAHFNQQV